jgi:AbrB family looped-hinge helix DNA binding protein
MEAIHTVTKKGTVTIPVKIRKKHNLKEGSKVKFIETENGALIMPVLSLADLRGIDKKRKDIVYKMIRELQAERRQEALHGV